MQLKHIFDRSKSAEFWVVEFGEYLFFFSCLVLVCCAGDWNLNGSCIRKAITLATTILDMLCCEHHAV
jgi:hypothetical protein